MPTQTMRRGVLRWRAQVFMDGKIVASKWFGSTKEDMRQAILWEEKTKVELAEQAKEAPSTTVMASLSVGEWANAYLDDVKLRKAPPTLKEKVTAFKALFQRLKPETPVEDVTPALVLKHLQGVYRSRSGYAANKDRKNLATAWKWGQSFLDGFPTGDNPFLKASRFPEEKEPRYVPSEEDFWKVLDAAEGQDKVLLLAYLHTGARRSELFRLKWSDVDFSTGRIRLTTKKTADGSMKAAWLPMTSDLQDNLRWWWENRPFKQAEHVFVVTEEQGFGCQYAGQPFRYRQHFMKKLCEKAGVKPFGFHAIRHLTATTLYQAGQPVAVVQAVLRHESAQTTTRYLAGLGLEQTRDALEGVMGKRGPAKVIPFKTKEAVGV